MNLKAIIEKLKNPAEITHATLFPREIMEMPNLYNRKPKNEYLNRRFNGEAIAHRKFDRSMAIQLAVFALLVGALLALAYLRQ